MARRFALVLLVALTLTLAPAALAATRETALEANVLQEINQVRRAHGLPPFKLSAKLAAAAAQHSNEMGADGYFAHESANHSAFWKRVARWYPPTGDLSGISSLSVLVWLGVWAGLSRAWKACSVDSGRVLGATLRLSSLDWAPGDPELAEASRGRGAPPEWKRRPRCSR